MKPVRSQLADGPREHLLIGLTGGIGSGKSTVASLFEKLGVRVIDTDELSHLLTKSEGEAIPAIRNAFGSDYIDTTGALDRSRMRDLVFSYPTAKKQLEAILHPAILALAKQQAAVTSFAPYTLVVIPLLFEGSNYQNWLHRILVVDCPEEVQILRTMQRSGLDKAFVQTIINQQISRTRRLSLSDEVICNNSDLLTLTSQVQMLHDRFLHFAAGSD